MSRRNIGSQSLSSRRHSFGLSLVELMVALVLGAIIVLGLAQLFVNISSTNEEMAKTNSQIESARFAMQFLRDDLAHAGFWGGYVPPWDDLSNVLTPDDETTELGGLAGAIPNPCRPIAEWDEDGTDPDYVAYRNRLLGVPIQVYSGSPNADCDGLMVDQQANTDVLVVRHANICEPGTGYCDDDGTEDHLYFQASFCNSDPVEFSLSTVTNLLDRTCTAGVFAPRRKYVQSIYYVRQWANTPGDGVPTLVRSQFGPDALGALAQQAAVPLVEGIERFRVEVGIDDVTEPFVGAHAGSPGGRTLTIADLQDPIAWEDEDNWEIPTNRGDGAPDGNFVHCPTAGCSLFQLLNVVAVKLYVMARATEATAGYTDTKTYTMGSSGAIGPFGGAAARFKRHVYSTTVRLNNISGRRETP